MADGVMPHKVKDYPLHGRERSVSELEHENDMLRRKGAKLQSRVMVSSVIIQDLQKEIEEKDKLIASLKRKLSRADKSKRAEQSGRKGTSHVPSEG